MKTITLCLLTAAQLLAAAQRAETSAHLQYEYLDFSGSRQKEDGTRATLYVGHRIGKQFFQAAFEKTQTNTYQPPLKEDLDVTKLYLIKTSASVAPVASTVPACVAASKRFRRSCRAIRARLRPRNSS